MKQLQQILLLSLFALFFVSCSGTKAAKTQTSATSENQTSTAGLNGSAAGSKSKNETSSANDKNTAKDGSSVKNAIKVKSIQEEYQIVRKICPDCKINGQSLISEGNKHYDLLRATNEKGEEVNYYFDINSFFGKW